MADGSDALLARTVSSIDEIDAETWDALANRPGEPFNPFVAHAFLSALEHSQSVAPEAGWAPMHLVLEEAGEIIAAAPLYAKGHSAGEYVFDHHWADAYERAGIITRSFFAQRRSRRSRGRACSRKPMRRSSTSRLRSVR